MVEFDISPSDASFDGHVDEAVKALWREDFLLPPEILCYGVDPATGHFLKIGGSEREDGVRGASGGPDFIVTEQVFVDVGFDGRSEADGRNAADGKAGALADEIGVGFADEFASEFA